MNKPKIKNNTYVVTERAYDSSASSEYNYSLWVGGNQTFYEVSADEVREIIACLQNALNNTIGQKGGAQ